MPNFRRVLVAVPPRDAEATLDYADLIARVLLPETIRLLHLSPPSGAAILDDDGHERVVGALPGRLQALGREGRLSLGTVNADVLDDTLREADEMHADLLLVGSEPAATSRRVLERRLAMSAPCSVWIVPAGAPPRLTRVLAPIDFSPRSADALEVATAIAAMAGAESCDALHVRFDAAVARPAELDDMVAGREQDAFNIFTARVDLHGVDLSPVFEEGADVARTILRVAFERQSDLVVMGTRGRTRAASMLIGSETEHALQSSDVPVLAVKHFGSRMRLREALADPRFRQREEPRFS